MRSGAAPLLFGEAIQDLRRGLARPAHRLDRRLDRPVRCQLSSELDFVIAADHGVVLCNQAPKPDRGHHLAVGKMVRDHPRGPLVAPGAIELLLTQALKRFHHGVVPVPIALDQSLSLMRVHLALLTKTAPIRPWSRCRPWSRRQESKP